ncbi:transglutaminase-like domain-containing protein [Planctomonas psychrotolerans]|uniref:transglutaminase-like domain-containing protein n=1 Tax=Planctomonas psychrotolerans TaxID=2528712 RepID=UPI001239F71C|nr:transglutaminase family protein [Planctomonas psychrotolerans]
MKRSAAAHLEFDVAGAAEIVLSVAVAGSPTRETLLATLDGTPFALREVLDAHGTRLHVADCPPGQVVVDYTVEQGGPLPPAEVAEIDTLRYVRPSRYCESDTLGPTARSQFSGLAGRALLEAVSSWVGQQLAYVPGSSAPTDGAVQTLLSRRGVCRDFAHLVVTLLRALDVPARLVSVYAPGLYPMDFHAVAEAYFDGEWHVIDATALAPRQSLMRIATGRDASDTAFLSTSGGFVSLVGMEITAVVDELPTDDVRDLVRLG